MFLMRTWAVRKPTQCSTVNYDAFNQSVTIKFYFRCDRKIVVFLENRKLQVLFFAVNRKKIPFSWNVSMRFRKLKKTSKLCSKKWWTGHIFCPHFSSFCAKRKSMLTILKINVLVDMMLQTMDKTVSYLRKTQFFVLGHVTLTVSWRRHQPAYIYTLNLFSEFDQNKSEVMSSFGQLNFP